MADFFEEGTVEREFEDDLKASFDDGGTIGLDVDGDEYACSFCTIDVGLETVDEMDVMGMAVDVDEVRYELSVPIDIESVACEKITIHTCNGDWVLADLQSVKRFQDDEDGLTFIGALLFKQERYDEYETHE